MGTAPACSGAVSPSFPQQIRGKRRLTIRLKYIGKMPLLRLVGALIVIMDLVEQAAAIGFKRPVIDARRAAGVSRRVERFAALAFLVVADNEIAGDHIDLFPMIVHERRSRVGAGVEAKEPGAASHFAGLVEVARKNLLLDARWVPCRRRPAAVHVYPGEFEMGLVHGHFSSSALARIIAVSLARNADSSVLSSP